MPGAAGSEYDHAAIFSCQVLSASNANVPAALKELPWLRSAKAEAANHQDQRLKPVAPSKFYEGPTERASEKITALPLRPGRSGRSGDEDQPDVRQPCALRARENRSYPASQ